MAVVAAITLIEPASERPGARRRGRRSAGRAPGGAGRCAHPAGRDRARPAGGAVQPRVPGDRRGVRAAVPAGRQLVAGVARGGAVPDRRGCGSSIGSSRSAPTTWRCRAPRRRAARRRPASSCPTRRTEQLVRQTEGWPAALYLAALPSGPARSRPPARSPATDRLMSDYLRSEVLDRLSRSQRRFLVRTSILERVSGPLGDAVVGGARCGPDARAAAAPEPAGAARRR